MNATINGEHKQFEADSMSLKDLLSELGLANHPVVIEHNGEALLPAEHADAIVNDGDCLEIVRVVAGG